MNKYAVLIIAGLLISCSTTHKKIKQEGIQKYKQKSVIHQQHKPVPLPRKRNINPLPPPCHIKCNDYELKDDASCSCVPCPNNEYYLLLKGVGCYQFSEFERAIIKKSKERGYYDGH